MASEARANDVESSNLKDSEAKIRDAEMRAQQAAAEVKCEGRRGQGCRFGG